MVFGYGRVFFRGFQRYDYTLILGLQTYKVPPTKYLEVSKEEKTIVLFNSNPKLFLLKEAFNKVKNFLEGKVRPNIKTVVIRLSSASSGQSIK